MAHRVRRGLDLPLAGQPEQRVEAGPEVTRVAVLARDFVGMKPRMLVQADDTVKRGDPLFEDRKTPGVFHVAPGAGRIVDVNRGDKRALLSVVVALDGDDDEHNHRTFDTKVESGADVRRFLVETGLWTALRTRPFSRVPQVDAEPKSVFVTATDSNPLAPDPAVTIAGREEDFHRGLRAVSKLTTGATYLCRAPGAKIDAGDSPAKVEEFGGKHPAGTVGYHIHVLDPGQPRQGSLAPRLPGRAAHRQEPGDRPPRRRAGGFYRGPRGEAAEPGANARRGLGRPTGRRSARRRRVPDDFGVGVQWPDRRR